MLFLEVLVFVFRFLLVWTALSVAATAGFCWWALARRTVRTRDNARPGDME